MKLKINSKIILVLILVLGFAIRGINLNNNPPSLYGDELTIVYDSYSLLKTGHDQTGEFLPLTFKMGAGRPAGYVYGSIPFVWLFGPTALGVRGLSFLSGVLMIWLIFLISRKLLDEKIALIAAFLMAVNPWAISVSRGGFEANFACMLALSGLYFLIKAETKKWFYILSAVCFGLTIHTYPTFKIVIPLFLLLYFWLIDTSHHLQKQLKNKFVLVAILVLVFFGSVSIWQTFSAASEGRFLSINVFSQRELSERIIQKVNNDRNLSDLPAFFKMIFYNRVWEYQQILLNAYLKNFSLDYLFLSGDQAPRHNMSEMGGFYLVELIFFVLGIKYLFLNNRKLFNFLIVWILIVPIPTALLLDPHNLRNLFMMPPLIILSAVGLFVILDKKYSYKPVLMWCILGLFLIQLVVFNERVFFLSSNKLSRFWAYPAKAAAFEALESSKKYDVVLVTDRIDNVEYALPVYGQINPQNVIDQNTKENKLGDIRVKQFGNIYIGAFNPQNVESVASRLDGSVLYLGEGGDKLLDLTYNAVRSKDGLPAYIFVPIK